MNCFQNLLSLIFWTTIEIEQQIIDLLWIAFKICYLWYSEQQIGESIYTKNGCELLSKFAIFDILNNPMNISYRFQTVVNCFQNLLSLIFWTTFVKKGVTNGRLWIAFKICYLWYSEQLFWSFNKNIKCCELLSKFAIFDILNNISTSHLWP